MRKRRKIDGIVTGVLLYWLVFVTVAWVCYFIKDGIPDTLVQVGLGGGAVELVTTATIEILSNKRKGEENADSSNSGADLHDRGNGVDGGEAD